MARKIKRYGWRPQLTDHRDRELLLRTVALAPSVDMRGLMPPVYDQGDLGSCTANMGAGMFQFCALKEAFSDHEVPSRLFIYYNERVADGDPETDGGSECRTALKVLAAQGSIPETEWPYDITQFAVKPPDQCYADAKVEKALEYLAVDQNLDAIKTTLMSGYPVGFGFTVYQSFESPAVAKTGIMPMPGLFESPVGGHAVIWAGYFDNAALPANIPPHNSGGYLIVRNSWGLGWGLDASGYFLMPYSALRYCSDFWVLRTVGS